MRWDSPAKQDPTQWHLWFAWRPVHIPGHRYKVGQWVWLEEVERKFDCSHSDCWASYRLPTELP